MCVPSNFVGLVRLPIVLALLALTVSSESASGAGANEWRYWQKQQGMADSFVAAVSRDQAGGLWLTQGDIAALTYFDGRKFTQLSAPLLHKRFDSIDGKSGWSVDMNGLYQFQDGKWNTFKNLKITLASHEMRSKVIDLGSSQALLLFPGKLAMITSLPGSARLQSSEDLGRVATPPALLKIGGFVSFERDLEGGVWLIGEQGVAHFLYDPSSGLHDWKISPLQNLPVSDLETGIACPGGELFVSGLDPHNKQSVALRLSHGVWELIARQLSRSQTLLAWRDGNGDLWKSDGNTLFRKPSADAVNQWERVDSPGQVLAGKIAQVLVNRDGSFFIATARGLALHVNPAWKEFGTALDSHGRLIELRQAWIAVMEDRRNRLWFLGQRSLLRFSGGQWDEYLLPKDSQIDVNDPSALGELEDGRILVQLYTIPYLTIFDPGKLTFASVRYPAGARPIIFSKRKDGRFDVAMTMPNGQPDALAILDGNSITDPKPIDGKWNLNYSRAMLRDRTGELWLGGTSGLFRLANGKYQRLPSKKYGAEWEPESAYSFLDEKNADLLVGGRNAIYRWTDNRLELLTNQIEATRKMIRDRSGTLWAASGSGVFRGLRGQTVGRVPTTRDWFANNESDGLPSAVAQSMIEDSQGRVWIATTRGPALFRPNTDTDAPETIIRPDENSTEAPSSGLVQIIFSGQDKWSLTPADSLQFSHRLDGGPWSPFSESKIATLRGASVGRHEFEVVALDRSGNTDPSPARFLFTVVAPWYRTAGFLGILSLALAVIAYLGWQAHRRLGQLRELATLDGLTGNWNRRMIFQLLTNALDQARRKGGTIAVIMVDVDKFKCINDEYGHPVGDLVLREVARRLRSCTRTTDHFGRYGGEEFLIVLPNCDSVNALTRAEELRRAVECQRISTGDNELTVTCSFGVNWTKGGSYDLQELLRKADAALYAAKQSGRNCVGAAPTQQLLGAI
jgi:diguanylate cyclase (GGDEF)-like protein